MPKSPAQEAFLLVEDDPNDADLLTRSLRKAQILNPVHTVSSAEEALDYLHGQGPYSDRVRYPLPGLILLDLRLPKMTGFELLTEIRQNPRFRDLRVTVLTASKESPDINRAHELGANSVLVKPLDFERFVEISNALSGAWLWSSRRDFNAPTAEPLLLVEDREDDAAHVREAFNASALPNPIYNVNSAEEAIAYLTGEGPFADRQQYPFPALVVLDIKLPGISGFDLLCWIRSHPQSTTLPVVFLTSSTWAKDLERAYQLGANLFLVKPLHFDKLVSMCSALLGHWLTMMRALKSGPGILGQQS